VTISKPDISPHLFGTAIFILQHICKNCGIFKNYLHYLLSYNRTESKGFQVSNSCQPIFHGLSATVCNKPGESPDSNAETTEFHVSTVALNLTSAGTLHFTIGQTSCTIGDQDMTASMGLNTKITTFYGQLASPYDTECSNWKTLQTIAR
jgi:hypothetical protein